MIIVSDTTPLHYLVQIGKVDILEKLFEHVIIPQAVFNEMQQEKTPSEVRTWIESHPSWLEVRGASSTFTSQKKLGDGEREAIALALELRAHALLIDDRDGVKEARRNNIPVITTPIILDVGAQRKLLDLPDAFDQLSKETNFRMPPHEVTAEMLTRDAERKEREQEHGRLEGGIIEEEELPKEPDRNHD